MLVITGTGLEGRDRILRNKKRTHGSSKKSPAIFFNLRLTLKEHPDEASQMEKSYNQPADAIYPHNTQYPGLQYYLKTKKKLLNTGMEIIARKADLYCLCGRTDQPLL